MVAVMTDFACGEPGCDFEVPEEKRARAAQSLGMHRRKHRKEGSAGTDVAVKPAKRKYTKKDPQLQAFLQEQNIETATAYVIAAKFPNGVPVEEVPRVIRLVKAVEHG